MLARFAPRSGEEILSLALLTGAPEGAAPKAEAQEEGDRGRSQKDLLDADLSSRPAPFDGEGGDLGDQLVGEALASLRGLLPNQPFLADQGIEAINRSNGNLLLTIPLGQVFSVGPLLSYRLMASHNSDVWDHMTIECAGQGCESAFPHITYSLPQRNSNAGIGWEVHFGKLFAPRPPAPDGSFTAQTWPNRDHPEPDVLSRWLYVSPDGGSHHLYALPGRANSNGNPGSSIVRYTKDGSHIRMQQVGANTIHVEHPNGTLSEFRKTSSKAGNPDLWRRGPDGLLAVPRDA